MVENLNQDHKRVKIGQYERLFTNFSYHGN